MPVYSSSNMNCIFFYLKLILPITFLSTCHFLFICFLFFQTNFLLTDYSHDILNLRNSFIAFGQQMDYSFNLGQPFAKNISCHKY